MRAASRPRVVVQGGHRFVKRGMVWEDAGRVKVRPRVRIQRGRSDAPRLNERTDARRLGHLPTLEEYDQIDR